jgi:hypothetical protein
MVGLTGIQQAGRGARRLRGGCCARIGARRYAWNRGQRGSTDPSRDGKAPAARATVSQETAKCDGRQNQRHDQCEPLRHDDRVKVDFIAGNRIGAVFPNKLKPQRALDETRWNQAKPVDGDGIASTSVTVCRRIPYAVLAECPPMGLLERIPNEKNAAILKIQIDLRFPAAFRTFRLYPVETRLDRGATRNGQRRYGPSGEGQGSAANDNRHETTPSRHYDGQQNEQYTHCSKPPSRKWYVDTVSGRKHSGEFSR